MQLAVIFFYSSEIFTVYFVVFGECVLRRRNISYVFPVAFPDAAYTHSSHLAVLQSP